MGQAVIDLNTICKTYIHMKSLVNPTELLYNISQCECRYSSGEPWMLKQWKGVCVCPEDMNINLEQANKEQTS